MRKAIEIIKSVFAQDENDTMSQSHDNGNISLLSGETLPNGINIEQTSEDEVTFSFCFSMDKDKFAMALRDELSQEDPSSVPGNLEKLTSFSTDEFSRSDKSAVGLDAGAEEAIEQARRECKATAEECRARNPMACPFHGTMYMKTALLARLAAAGAKTTEAAITPLRNKGTFEAKVKCIASAKEKSAVVKAINSFLSMNGIDQESYFKSGKGDYDNGEFKSYFDIDGLNAEAKEEEEAHEDFALRKRQDKARNVDQDDKRNDVVRAHEEHPVEAHNVEVGEGKGPKREDENRDDGQEQGIYKELAQAENELERAEVQRDASKREYEALLRVAAAARKEQDINGPMLGRINGLVDHARAQFLEKEEALKQAQRKANAVKGRVHQIELEKRQREKDAKARGELGIRDDGNVTPPTEEEVNAAVEDIRKKEPQYGYEIGRIIREMVFKENPDLGMLNQFGVDKQQAVLFIAQRLGDENGVVKYLREKFGVKKFDERNIQKDNAETDLRRRTRTIKGRGFVLPEELRKRQEKGREEDAQKSAADLMNDIMHFRHYGTPDFIVEDAKNHGFEVSETGLDRTKYYDPYGTMANCYKHFASSILNNFGIKCVPVHSRSDQEGEDFYKSLCAFYETIDNPTEEKVASRLRELASTEENGTVVYYGGAHANGAILNNGKWYTFDQQAHSVGRQINEKLAARVARSGNIWFHGIVPCIIRPSDGIAPIMWKMVVPHNG